MRMQIFRVKQPSCKILETKNCVPCEVLKFRFGIAFKLCEATFVKDNIPHTCDEADSK